MTTVEKLARLLRYEFESASTQSELLVSAGPGTTRPNHAELWAAGMKAVRSWTEKHFGSAVRVGSVVDDTSVSVAKDERMDPVEGPYARRSRASDVAWMSAAGYVLDQLEDRPEAEAHVESEWARFCALVD